MFQFGHLTFPHFVFFTLAYRFLVAIKKDLGVFLYCAKVLESL